MTDVKAKILIVEDELIKRSVLEDELNNVGFKVTAVSNPIEAEPHVNSEHFDIILTDLRMPGEDGITFLKKIKEQHPLQAVIVMTAYGTVETAVQAMKLGAFDYIQKPFSTEELILKFDNVLRYEKLTSENEALRNQLSLRNEAPQMIGQSEAMKAILTKIHDISRSDTSVLIMGESGTGKELAARLIHHTSFRSAGPFVAVSCGALPRELIEAELFGHEAGAFTGAAKRRIGRFELAHGGTIFLDDVDDIQIELQVKLLRVLQEHIIERVGGERSIRVNIRVIAASKRPLTALIAERKFREDLYYRLNVVPISIPPLRERVEDIPLLVEAILKQLTIKLNRGDICFSPEAIEKLQHHSWPGNVRELEHFLERVIVLSTKDYIDAADIDRFSGDHEMTLSPSLTGSRKVTYDEVMQETEKKLIAWAMERSGGNLSKASEMLNIPRSTLQYKLRKQDS